MTKLILLSKIKDNPYRDKRRNPIDQDRVAQLVESIQSTDFWKGVYGREAGDCVEIAFGHCRVEAARKAGLKEIPIEIEEFSNQDMLMRMARENLRGELLVCLEAVSAAVKAYAVGDVGFEKVDPSTRKEVIRYAPSYIPGKEPSTPGVLRPYAADTLARFLGGTYVKPTREGLAQNSVLAALGILEMEERKVEGFSERVLRNNNDEGEKYLGAKKVIKIISDIKAKEIKITERREKTAEEIAKYNAEQLRLAQEEKAREKEAKEIKEALVRQIADAHREEDEKKERALKAKLDAEKKKAEETAADFKVKRKALDIKVEDIKEAETHARKEDAYAPIRRDIESVLRKVEGTTACSRASLEEEAKVLRRKAMHVEDRERLRQAALNVGNWYKETLASMFLPPMSAKQELTESKQREETKRRTAKRREK